MTKQNRHPNRPNLVIAAGLFVIVFAGVLGVATNIWLAKSYQSALDFGIKLENLRGRILFLDVVLTTSAQLAAVTGDVAWEKRYNDYEPELDHSIKEAINEAPNAYTGANAKTTDEANIALVKMERESFRRVKEHDQIGAKNILFSEEYDKQKNIYSLGMTEFSAKLTEYIALSKAKSDTHLICAISITIFMTIGLLMAWLFVRAFLNRWNVFFDTLNENLEQRAQERAKELIKKQLG